MSRYDFLYPAGITFAFFMIQQSFRDALLFGDLFALSAGTHDVWIQFLAWPVWIFAIVTIGVAIRGWTDLRGTGATTSAKEDA